MAGIINKIGDALHIGGGQKEEQHKKEEEQHKKVEEHKKVGEHKEGGGFVDKFKDKIHGGAGEGENKGHTTGEGEKKKKDKKKKKKDGEEHHHGGGSSSSSDSD